GRHVARRAGEVAGRQRSGDAPVGVVLPAPLLRRAGRDDETGAPRQTVEALALGDVEHRAGLAAHGAQVAVGIIAQHLERPGVTQAAGRLAGRLRQHDAIRGVIAATLGATVFTELAHRA